MLLLAEEEVLQPVRVQHVQLVVRVVSLVIRLAVPPASYHNRPLVRDVPAMVVDRREDRELRHRLEDGAEVWRLDIRAVHAIRRL